MKRTIPEKTHVYVACPGNTFAVREVPITLLGNTLMNINYCNFSNGVFPCDECMEKLIKLIQSDPSVIAKSFSCPLHL